MTGCIKHSAT